MKSIMGEKTAVKWQPFSVAELLPRWHRLLWAVSGGRGLPRNRYIRLLSNQIPKKKNQGNLMVTPLYYITRPYSYIVSLDKSICSFQNTQVLLWSS